MRWCLGLPGRSSDLFFVQAEDGIRDVAVTGVQTCALPIYVSGRNSACRQEHSSTFQQPTPSDCAHEPSSSELPTLLSFRFFYIVYFRLSKCDKAAGDRLMVAFRTAFWLVAGAAALDRKSTRLNSSHGYISYAVFCFKKKKTNDSCVQLVD